MVGQTQAFLPGTTLSEKTVIWLQMCLHIWSSLVPKEQTLQGWQVHPHPEHGSAEKRTLQEHWVSPPLLPNSLNIVQTWPQILWETLNSKELEGCNLDILLKNTNIVLGNRDSKGWTSDTFMGVLGHQGMNEGKTKQNKQLSILFVAWHHT